MAKRSKRKLRTIADLGITREKEYAPIRLSEDGLDELKDFFYRIINNATIVGKGKQEYVDNVKNQIKMINSQSLFNYCLHPFYGKPFYNGELELINDMLCNMIGQNDMSFMFAGEDPFDAYKDMICFCAIADEWKKYKQAYVPDRDFANELVNTENLRVYPSLLKRIPFDNFYLDFRNLEWSGDYEGAYVKVVVSDNDDVELLFYRIIGQEYYSYFWHADHKAMEDGYISITHDDFDIIPFSTRSSYLEKTMGSIKRSNDGFDKLFTFVLQFLMYISSKEPDVVCEDKAEIKRKARSRFERSKAEVNTWNVGIRFGEVVRTRRMHYDSGEHTDGSNCHRKSPRPHARKAHWRHCRTGKGRVNVEVRWIAATFVSGNDLPTMVNEVAV